MTEDIYIYISIAIRKFIGYAKLCFFRKKLNTFKQKINNTELKKTINEKNA